MKINIRIKLYKYKKLTDGTHPIVVWLSSGKERKYFSAGYSVKLKDWDDSEKTVKSKHPLSSKINKELARLRAKCEDAYLDLQKFQEGDFTVDTLYSRIRDGHVPHNVLTYFDNVTSRLNASGNIGNARAYSSTGQVLSNFLGKKDIRFSELTASKLEKFKEYLNKNNVGDVTKHFYFRQLRALFNRAITDGYASNADYPFNKFKISQFNTSTPKRAISKKEVNKILKYDSKKKLDFQTQLALDFFKFSYLSAGMNFTDFAKLRWSDLKNDHYTYRRSKTGQLITVPISSRLKPILDRYRVYMVSKDGFIFPVLNDFHNTPMRVQNRIQKVRGQINSSLKDIGTELGIPKLRGGVARHTAASVMRDAGVPVTAISKSLGHSNLSTTEIYLSDLNQEVIDNALNKL